MTGCKAVGAALLAALLASCVPARAPSSAYGDALRACDKQPSDDEWVECCVAAARAYGRDPGFCFK